MNIHACHKQIALSSGHIFSPVRRRNVMSVEASAWTFRAVPISAAFTAALLLDNRLRSGPLLQARQPNTQHHHMLTLGRSPASHSHPRWPGHRLLPARLSCAVRPKMLTVCPIHIFCWYVKGGRRGTRQIAHCAVTNIMMIFALPTTAQATRKPFDC